MALDTDVVRPCLKIAFREGELRRAETVVLEHAGQLDPDYRPVIRLDVETSAGDKVGIYIWQPEVEQFSTVAGIRAHLLSQLEYWLPESRLRWGEEIHLRWPTSQTRPRPITK